MDKIAVFVIYDRAIDEEVLAALGGVRYLERFTRWHDVPPGWAPPVPTWATTSGRP